MARARRKHAAAAESAIRHTRPFRAAPRRSGQVYTDQGAIVTDAFHASNLIGATPTGRPEDIEVHPIDRSVYIAFTAAATAPGNLFPNLYGEIWRIEDEADGAGMRFTWMRWKAGGPNDPAQGGHVFAAPDNLSFDPAGHLWIVTDITSSRLNAHAGYAAFANNGMFFVPASGPDAGVALQFASAPCEAELSGPSWTADRNTLFLSVQHPGEASGMRTAAMTPPRGSNWPGRSRQSAAAAGGRLDPRPLGVTPILHRLGMVPCMPKMANYLFTLDVDAVFTDNPDRFPSDETSR